MDVDLQYILYLGGRHPVFIGHYLQTFPSVSTVFPPLH